MSEKWLSEAAAREVTLLPVNFWGVYPCCEIHNWKRWRGPVGFVSFSIPLSPEALLRGPGWLSSSLSERLPGQNAKIYSLSENHLQEGPGREVNSLSVNVQGVCFCCEICTWRDRGDCRLCAFLYCSSSEALLRVPGRASKNCLLEAQTEKPRKSEWKSATRGARHKGAPLWMRDWSASAVRLGENEGTY